MKYLPILFLALVMGCAQEEGPEINCQLADIVVVGTNYVTQTTYTYSASGKMHTQVRTNNGDTIFNYTYHYNANGKVDKVDMVYHYLQWAYAPDGKVATITNYSMDETLIGTEIYTWSGNNVEIKHTKPEKPNPYQVTELEFLNDNLVRRTYKYYTGDEPNVLNRVTESQFEDFDTALSAFYVAKSTRPGYNSETTKNNPRKQIGTSTTYEDGVVTNVSTSTTVFSYTYNDSNATLTTMAITNGTIVVDTEITYQQCN